MFYHEKYQHKMNRIEILVFITKDLEIKTTVSIMLTTLKELHYSQKQKTRSSVLNRRKNHSICVICQ